MSENLIVVKQLPIIEDQLRSVRPQIEKRTKEILAMACTKETIKTIKEYRAELNKEAKDLESRRKDVKKLILEPYERFEAVYRENIGDIYREADETLKARITEVEDTIKAETEEEIRAYFEEYRQSIGLESEYSWDRTNIKIGLSNSKKSIKASAKAWLDDRKKDLAIIELQDHADEILVEYKKDLDVSKAVTTVKDRHDRIEAEQKRREDLEAQRRMEAKRALEIAEIAAREREEERRAKMQSAPAVAAPVAVPQSVPAPVEQSHTSDIKCLKFAVYGTIDQLRELKSFLDQGGFRYESIK